MNIWRGIKTRNEILAISPFVILCLASVYIYGWMNNEQYARMKRPCTYNKPAFTWRQGDPPNFLTALLISSSAVSSYFFPELKGIEKFWALFGGVKPCCLMTFTHATVCVHILPIYYSLLILESRVIIKQSQLLMNISRNKVSHFRLDMQAALEKEMIQHPCSPYHPNPARHVSFCLVFGGVRVPHDMIGFPSKTLCLNTDLISDHASDDIS